MFWKYPQDFKKVQYKPGEIAEYVFGDGILLARIQVSSDVKGSIHDYEQISMMLEGEIELTIGEEMRRLRKGDAFYIPASVLHRVRVISIPCTILDCWPCGGPEIPD